MLFGQVLFRDGQWLWGHALLPIDSLDGNKDSMVALATSVFLTKSRIRIAFLPNNLNCADIPKNTQIYDVRVTEF